MQATTAQATPVDRRPRCVPPRRPAPAAVRPTRATRSSAATARSLSFEPNKIAVALTKAFLAVNGTQGAASARVRETVDGLTEIGRARAAALASGRRHLPHRGHPGPGRARPDARRRARGRARLRAVSRAARAGARQAGPGAGRQGRAGADGHRPRRARAARRGARCRRWSSPPAPASAPTSGRADPGRDASATSTTACRSTRCTRRRSSPRAR